MDSIITEPAVFRSSFGSRARATTPAPVSKVRMSPATLALLPSSGSEAEQTTLKLSHKVLSTASTALANVTRLYETEKIHQASLLSAVERIVNGQKLGSKTVVCAIGKSGVVGLKLVATMKSFGMRACFLHPADALHGDVGDVIKFDTIVFISYSGKTPELRNVLPYLPKDIDMIAITAQTDINDVALLNDISDKNLLSKILLPAPVLESEDQTFGVPAPTTSTSVALAVADMLALSCVERMTEGGMTGVRKKFLMNHPGGAIGLIRH